MLRQRKRPLPNSVCFHSQQCAEKYLKAVLAAQGQEIPRIHDLILLLEEIIPRRPEYELLRDVLRALNPYAVEVRYPGEGATTPQARRAVKSAMAVRSFVRERMGLR